MAVIELHDLEASRRPCDCCGGVSHTVWGYAADRDGTFACYFAGWVEGAHDRVLWMTVGLGPWGSGSTPADRRAFAIETRFVDGVPQMMATDERLFDHEQLGVALGPEQALASPLITTLWQVADHVVTEDARLVQAMRWLSGETASFTRRDRFAPGRSSSSTWRGHRR